MSELNTYKPFNGATKLGESYLLNQLEDNYKTFFDWGFLTIGGFINVNIPTTGLYGGDFHQLKTTETPGYKLGQVWQSHKKDWIWETGIYYNDGYFDNNTPNNITGIYVNNTFLPGPTGVANSGYHINYPLGQIVFDKPMPKNAKVELNYSYRWCQIYKDSSDPYWKELQELTYSPNPAINQPKTGDYSISANHRVQMPCIIIESIARSNSDPWGLGSYEHIINQDFLLHVFTENSHDKQRIADIIRLQKGQCIKLYDINKVVNSGVNCLNYDGSLNHNRIQYDGLIKDYFWKSSYIQDIKIIDMQNKNKNLYWCTLRITSQTIT